MKRNFQRLFVMFLFAWMSLTVVFRFKFGEPYPAIYQPAFSHAPQSTETVEVQLAELTAISPDGRRTELDYSQVYDFTPDKRDVQMYYATPEDAPKLPDSIPHQAGYKHFMNWFYGDFIAGYEWKMEHKRAAQYQEALGYLHKNAEKAAGHPVKKMELRLYLITKNLKTQTLIREKLGTKTIVF